MEKTLIGSDRPFLPSLESGVTMKAKLLGPPKAEERFHDLLSRACMLMA